MTVPNSRIDMDHLFAQSVFFLEFLASNLTEKMI